MQTLWSRAARTPGTCRCVSCASTNTTVTKALARRVSPKHLQGAWVLGTPTSTLLYTAIFTAGIAIDGRAKHRRNEQWDTAFAHLREDTARSGFLEEPRQDYGEQDLIIGNEESISGKSHMKADELSANGVDWRLIHDSVGMELTDDTILEQRQAESDPPHLSDNFWHLLRFDSRFPHAHMLDWQPNTGPSLVRHHLPPQSLWAYDHIRRKALKRRQTWKKLAIQELSMALLVRSLLREVDLRHRPSRFLGLISSELRPLVYLDTKEFHKGTREILDARTSLEKESADELRIQPRLALPGVPQYRQDSDGDFYSICGQMNASIKHMFTQVKDATDTNAAATTIAKICHNLLVCSAPPDVQTFNLLIAGFKRWKYPRLVDWVIEALENCKIRPNEITCASILDHYTQSDRPGHFSRFVSRMRGVGDALMLARPDIKINEAGQGRLVRQSETKVYQKVHPTPMVFNSLMLGVLKFAGFERALDIYYEMKSDGWGLDVLGLSQLLVDCTYRNDWSGGLYVWQEINTIKENANAFHVIKAYSNMLSLCSVTGNTAAFNQILQDVVRQGFDQTKILKNAMSLTRKVQRGQGAPVPAFTADNLLIAVSEYLSDSATSSDSKAFEVNEVAAITVRSSAPRSDMDKPEAVWDTWMEHELGERSTGGPR